MSNKRQAVEAVHDHTRISSSLLLVVPCYNEEHRLRFDVFETAANTTGVSFLFVDDGSTDNTLESLRRWSAGIQQMSILALGSNLGKGEAVRHGLLAGIRAGSPFVGYLDADLAAPIDEVLRMHALLQEQPQLEVILGSRVALLGSHIDRSFTRHLQGRVFATLASMALNLPVYDTQCGAKVFRTTPTLEAALVEPFRSRWIFDVDLLSRMLRTPHPLTSEAIIEMPLREWHDIDGSHLSLSGRISALAELCWLWGATKYPQIDTWAHRL